MRQSRILHLFLIHALSLFIFTSISPIFSQSTDLFLSNSIGQKFEPILFPEQEYPDYYLQIVTLNFNKNISTLFHQDKKVWIKTEIHDTNGYVLEYEDITTGTVTTYNYKKSLLLSIIQQQNGKIEKTLFFYDNSLLNKVEEYIQDVLTNTTLYLRDNNAFLVAKISLNNITGFSNYLLFPGQNESILYSVSGKAENFLLMKNFLHVANAGTGIEYWVNGKQKKEYTPDQINGNQIIEKIFDKDGSIMFTEYYDDSGLLLKSVDNINSITTSYFYNENNQLIREFIQKLNGTEDVVYIYNTNGEIIQIEYKINDIVFRKSYFESAGNNYDIIYKNSTEYLRINYSDDRETIISTELLQHKD